MTKHTDTSRSGDLVERLRWGEWYFEDPFDGKAYASDDPLDAATLIETQAREIERLRGALQFYAREYNWKSCGVYMCGHSNPSSAEIDRGNKARAALAGGPND